MFICMCLLPFWRQEQGIILFLSARCEPSVDQGLFLNAAHLQRRGCHFARDDQFKYVKTSLAQLCHFAPLLSFGSAGFSNSLAQEVWQLLGGVAHHWRRQWPDLRYTRILLLYTVCVTKIKIKLAIYLMHKTRLFSQCSRICWLSAGCGLKDWILFKPAGACWALPSCKAEKGFHLSEMFFSERLPCCKSQH